MIYVIPVLAKVPFVGPHAMLMVHTERSPVWCVERIGVAYSTLKKDGISPVVVGCKHYQRDLWGIIQSSSEAKTFDIRCEYSTAYCFGGRFQRRNLGAVVQQTNLRFRYDFNRRCLSSVDQTNPNGKMFIKFWFTQYFERLGQYPRTFIKSRCSDAGIQRGLSLSVAGLQCISGVVSNPLFLTHHALSGLPDLVGSTRNTLHVFRLGFGSVRQSVSVLGAHVNLVELPSREAAIENGGHHSNARENDDQLIVDRNRSPFLPQRSLLGWTVIAAGIACIGYGCYNVLLYLCFSASRIWLGLATLLLGIGLFNLGLFFLLYHKKLLTSCILCNTVSGMSNVLSRDKQIAVIGALAEGSSIRSIERITGIHRDTIMRLGVRVGQGCAMLLDSKMQDLGCQYLQFDEVWGFIGKKERHLRVEDSPELGDVWTYCAIDPETKLVPSFKCGKRTLATTTEFVQDVASRMRHRVQVSSDAMHSYVEAMELAFGADVDYGQCVKVYVHDDAQHPERKYSAPHFASAMRRPITGNPKMELVSTSYVERLNATTRLHVKRLSRLTLAFSKKLDSFKAAVALHFAYYNLVKRHNTLRCTPAMAAGVERNFLTVGDLVDVAV